MDTLGKRIRFARSAKKLTQLEVASHFYIDRVNVSQWESDTTKPDFDRMFDLAKMFDTTIEWLVNGEGEPPRPVSTVSPKERKPRLVSSFDPDEDVYSGNGYTREHWKPHTAGAIPELDVRLGAGNGTIGEVINLPVGDNSVSGHKVIREWLIPVDYLQDEIKASPRHSTIMEVIGDSMQPTYLPGDRVIVDLSQDTMSADTVYAISYDDEPPQIKRLQKVPFSDPKQVKIISDNPILETFSVELDKLTIIGRICGHIARK